MIHYLLLWWFAGPDFNTTGKTPVIVVKQIDDYSRNVGRLQLPGILVAWRVAAKLGIHRPRHDVTNLDAVMSHFLHQRFTETVEAKLRGVVSGHPRMRIGAGKRGNVDDVPAAALLHERNGFVATVEDTEEIRFQYCAKVFRRDLFNRCKNPDARIVDENIDAA